MDLFEYQGKQYFARFGIPVSPGGVADTVDEAVAQADTAGYPVVVKAQVQVGGRGKAGGIKLANDADEVRMHAGNILGMDIKGHVVKRLWVEHASDIAEEYYASFTLDRSAKKHLLMLSAAGRRRDRAGGGETDPDAIVPLHIDPVDGLIGRRRRARRAQPAKLNPAATDGAADILVKLYRLLRRGRLRPGRDQPADPHARGQGPRPRRQGEPRRQRRLPPPRVGGVPRPPRSSTSASSWPARRACSTSASRAPSASSPTAPAWP